MKICIVSVLTASLALITPASLATAADPPSVDRFSPAGGQRGTTVNVRIAGKPGDGDIRWIPAFADQSPATATPPTPPGWFTFTLSEKRDAADIAIAPDAPVGVHWVRFANAAGATELRPFFVGTLPEISETEPNARISEANPVPGEAVTVNAALEKAGDVDTYAVTVTSGRTLVASITANRVLKSPMDGVLQIVDARGTVVAQNDDDCSRDPLVEFTAPSDGTWYVRVFAFPAEPNSSIAFAGGADYLYRLTVTSAACLHHTVPLARQSSAGELRLQLQGWNLTTPDAVLGASQTVLEGPFALPWKVASVPEPVVVEDQLPPERSLSAPVAVSARLSTAESDEFTLVASKNTKYSISAEVEEFGSLLDPVLTLTDPSGKVLKEADDSDRGDRDSRIDFTAAVDGPHRIAVRDRFLSFGPRFFYLLRCTPTQPSVSLAVKSSAITLPAEKPAEIPVTITRRNGYSEVLDLRVEGLPEGITAECPQSAKDGETSKTVTLKLSGRPADPAAWSGPIRIFAAPVVAADPAATAPPTPAPPPTSFPVSWEAPDATPISTLWLTVPAKPQ
ncbi:MAG: PPC domain-containing protein [Planctomycetota bacterium]